jgi:hypothetical protein
MQASIIVLYTLIQQVQDCTVLLHYCTVYSMVLYCIVKKVCTVDGSIQWPQDALDPDHRGLAVFQNQAPVAKRIRKTGPDGVSVHGSHRKYLQAGLFATVETWFQPAFLCCCTVLQPSKSWFNFAQMVSMLIPWSFLEHSVYCMHCTVLYCTMFLQDVFEFEKWTNLHQRTGNSQHLPNSATGWHTVLYILYSTGKLYRTGFYCSVTVLYVLYCFSPCGKQPILYVLWTTHHHIMLQMSHSK